MFMSFFSLARLKIVLGAVLTALGAIALVLVRKGGADSERAKNALKNVEEAKKSASFNQAMAEHSDQISDKADLVNHIREKGL